jgi:hypothetical protein
MTAYSLKLTRQHAKWCHFNRNKVGKQALREGRWDPKRDSEDLGLRPTAPGCGPKYCPTFAQIESPKKPKKPKNSQQGDGVEKGFTLVSIG